MLRSLRWISRARLTHFLMRFVMPSLSCVTSWIWRVARYDNATGLGSKAAGQA